MRKLHHNKNINKVLVRRIKNLFDTPLWMHNWGHVDILDSQCEVGSVRDYLDFYSWVTGVKRISVDQFFEPIYISPLPVIRKPIALRDDDAKLYYGVQIAEDFRIGVYIYKAGDTIYVHSDERSVALMLCAGCGRPIVGDMWVQTVDTCHIYCRECEDEYYFKCEECGEYFDEDYITASNDSSRHICEDCYEHNRSDEWFYCDECEEYCVGDSYYVERHGCGVTVCESCLDNYYHRCDECDEYYHEDDGRYIHDGWDTWVCDRCLEREYMVCESCGEYYRADDMHVADNGEYYCDSCYDELDEDGRDDDWNDDEGIRSYHDCRGGGYGTSNVGSYGMEYLIAETRADNPMLGVELEIDEGGHSNENARAIRSCIGWDYIICSSDSTLNHGFELVSCPADLISHLEKLNWLAGINKALELGYKSHDAGTCGLHTHIDRGFYEGEEAQVVDSKFVITLQNNVWWMRKFSRRDDRGGSWRWCEPNPRRYLGDEDKLDKESVKNKGFVEEMKNKDAYSHNLALNFDHGNTIEVRFYRGTLKYNSFVAALQCSDIWARLVKGISVDKATEIGLADFIKEAEKRDYNAFLSYLNERGISIDCEPKRKLVRYIETDEFHYINY